MSVESADGLCDAAFLGTQSSVQRGLAGQADGTVTPHLDRHHPLVCPEWVLLPAGVQALPSAELSTGCPRSPPHPEIQLIPCLSQQLRGLGLKQASL